MPPLIINPNSAVDVGDVQVRRNSYASENGIQPQYQIVLDVQGDEALLQGVKVFPIIAALPERYNLSFSSQWDAPFSNKSMAEAAAGIGGKVGAIISGGLEAGSAAGVIGSRNKYQLAQVWQSSSPVSFNLDFVFNAKTNTRDDILLKHVALLKLAAPSDIGAGVLAAPGPNLVSSNISGRRITLYLGTYIKMEDVIVESVSSDVQTLCGADGIPHSMTINVELKSFFAGVTTQEIEKMFKLG